MLSVHSRFRADEVASLEHKEMTSKYLLLMDQMSLLKEENNLLKAELSQLKEKYCVQYQTIEEEEEYITNKLLHHISQLKLEKWSVLDLEYVNFATVDGGKRSENVETKAKKKQIENTTPPPITHEISNDEFESSESLKFQLNSTRFQLSLLETAYKKRLKGMEERFQLALKENLSLKQKLHIEESDEDSIMNDKTTRHDDHFDEKCWFLSPQSYSLLKRSNSLCFDDNPFTMPFLSSRKNSLSKATAM